MESIRLDLVPDGAMPELHASQYDKGRRFRLNLLDFGIDYTLDGTETLTIEERKVDGNICVRVVANTFSGKKYVEFTTTEQMCACAGYNLCELHIVKGEDSIGTLNFILNVERSPIEGGLSGSEIENLYTQIDERVDVDVADIMDDYYKKSETYSSEEIDNALALKANASDVYDKTEIDTALALKANTSDVNTALALKADKATTYNKTEVDNLVSPKADKSYVDSELATKANSADVYNKTEADALLANKADANVLNNLAQITTADESTAEIVNVPVTWQSGYMGLNGTITGSSSYIYSSKMPVQEGDKIYTYRQSDGLPMSAVRFVTAFNGDTADSTKGTQNINSPYEVPSGVDGVVFSVSSAYGTGSTAKKETITIVKVPKEKADVDALYEIAQNGKPNSFVYDFNVTAGGRYTANDELEDECGYKICFRCKITSITGLVRVEKAINNTYGGGFGFDGTNIYQYINGSTTPAVTQAHGLTLKDYVAIVLDTTYTKTATLTISTNGGTYTKTLNYWRSNLGVLEVYSELDALTDCELSYSCEGLIKDTWIFGDSYLANTSTDRWAYYLVNSGHTNYLLNAYSGRNSKQALDALKVCLSLNRVPRRILWLMGMNDKDGTSAANSNWLSALNEVVALCQCKHIELVLATIPNTTSTNVKNTYKNAYVIASGYRYIEFAKAVTADGGSTWYTGMLSSDNVHPTADGALALYNCAVASVPELLT